MQLVVADWLCAGVLWVQAWQMKLEPPVWAVFVGIFQ